MNTFFYRIFRIIPKLRTIFYLHWNRLYFKLIGVQYGKNMHVFNKVYVVGKGSIKIGDNFVFTSGDGLNPLSRNIRGCFLAQTQDTVIEIGNNVGISATSLRARKGITIGNNVNIGADCLIIDTDAHPHDYMKRRRDYKSDNYLDEIPSAPIVIEDDVWIGARCQILKGVHIGARSIIASGSIVTKDVPADCVAAGVPARVIKKNETLGCKEEDSLKELQDESV